MHKICALRALQTGEIDGSPTKIIDDGCARRHGRRRRRRRHVTHRSINPAAAAAHCSLLSACSPHRAHALHDVISHRPDRRLHMHDDACVLVTRERASEREREVGAAVRYLRYGRQGQRRGAASCLCRAVPRSLLPAFNSPALTHSLTPYTLTLTFVMTHCSTVSSTN